MHLQECLSIHVYPCKAAVQNPPAEYIHTHTHGALRNARRISLLDLLTASDVLNLLLEQDHQKVYSGLSRQCLLGTSSPQTEAADGLMPLNAVPFALFGSKRDCSYYYFILRV